MANHATNIEAFELQARYCDANDAPVTGRLARAIAAALDDSTEVGRRVLCWPGQPIADAMPLRLAGGLHALWRAGAAPALAVVFTDRPDAAAEARAVAATFAAQDEALLPWLDGPPQTNEPGRSSSFVAGMLWLARRLPARFEVLEIGSSAGLNLMLDRYRYDFPGVSVGPWDAAIRLAPEWRGAPPPAGSIAFESIRGVDIAPVNLADPTQAARLSAYIWHEHEARFARMERAIAMVRERPPALEAGDAADWIEAQLAEPQREGVTRLLVHSIVWQYLGVARQARISAAMAAAGGRATEGRPLAWLALEANRVDFKHELVARYWPGGGEPVMLGRAHAHGAWLEWLKPG